MIDFREQAYRHALECYPAESCGLMVEANGNVMYWPCKNLAGETDIFILCPKDYLAASKAGEIKAVVHSHPNSSVEPSQADLVSCEATGLPWYIIGVPSGVWNMISPKGYVANLVGRTWTHGVLDCYSLIRDYYWQKLSVVLPDFKRVDNWWQNGGNLYLDNFSAVGFTVEEEPQAGDVLLMQIKAPVPNHGAIYLGDGVILHHLHGRLSCREAWDGYYRKNTTHILRYNK